jgi:hypothetical protein
MEVVERFLNELLNSTYFKYQDVDAIKLFLSEK